MGLDGFDPDELVNSKNKPPRDQFREARLDRGEIGKNQWPAQIDRAALDVLYGIAIGKTASGTDIGGTIDRYEFPEATGEFYVDGLREIAGSDSNLDRVLQRYDPDAVGDFVFHLNEFRNQLREIDSANMDVDRAIEALVEKAATQALERNAGSHDNEGAGLRQLRGSASVADLVLKLFSDPRIEAYADALINIVTEDTSGESLLARLDEPRMTTPLWQHQREALQNWLDDGQSGYVDMATATGKTVLGLGAIATRYGSLHPADSEIAGADGSNDPRVLVVAGNQLLLSQWREELDEHLDIPPSRTVPTETDRATTIELGWGAIEFRTAQSLLGASSFEKYDLVVLDEAHRYSKSRSEGRGWGDLFGDLVAASDAVLAMSGSIDGGWQGDAAAEEALHECLARTYRFSIPEARARGVIADFSWEVVYGSATEEDDQKLTEQTRVIEQSYDSLTGELDMDTLDVDEDELNRTFPTYATLRSFAHSNTGSGLRERFDAFDLFATALFTRQPIQWNLSPSPDAIVDLVVAHAPERKTVVLVQNYNDATRLRSRLADEEQFHGSDVITLESSDDDRMEKISRFNGRDGGVIIGPGDLLGVGVDMPDAEVAINVARGGVTPSLVQRIGRVLRNPEGSKQAQFYHIVPQATGEDAIDHHEDGPQLLRQAAEFRALGRTFKEPPSFSIADEAVGTTVATLERAGTKVINEWTDDDAVDFVETEAAADALRELHGAIVARDDDEANDRSAPVITEYWPSDDHKERQGDRSSPSSDDSMSTIDDFQGYEPTESASVSEASLTNGVRLSKTLVFAARRDIEGEEGDLQDRIESWTRGLIAAILQDDPPALVDDVPTRVETVPIELSEDTLSFVRTSCRSDMTPFDDPSTVVEAAIRDALGFEPGATESVTLHAPVELLRAAEAVGAEDFDAAFKDTLESMLSEQ